MSDPRWIILPAEGAPGLFRIVKASTPTGGRKVYHGAPAEITSAELEGANLVYTSNNNIVVPIALLGAAGPADGDLVIGIPAGERLIAPLAGAVATGTLNLTYRGCGGAFQLEPGVTVSVKQGGSVVATGITNASGVASFALSAGNYTATGSKPPRWADVNSPTVGSYVISANVTNNATAINMVPAAGYKCCPTGGCQPIKKTLYVTDANVAAAAMQACTNNTNAWTYAYIYSRDGSQWNSGSQCVPAGVIASVVGYVLYCPGSVTGQTTTQFMLVQQWWNCIYIDPTFGTTLSEGTYAAATALAAGDCSDSTGSNLPANSIRTSIPYDSGHTVMRANTPTWTVANTCIPPMTFNPTAGALVPGTIMITE